MTVNGLGPIMSTLYNTASASGSRNSNRNTNTRRRTQPRRRSRNNAPQYTFEDDDINDPSYPAFTDFFGANNGQSAHEAGVDLASLLRRVVSEGQRQGIDAMGALRAAGRVQDELARFQQDPSGWFEGVGERFRMPSLEQEQQTSRNRARGGRSTRQQTQTGQAGDSWWYSVANNVNDFLKREPDASTTNTRRRRT